LQTQAVTSGDQSVMEVAVSSYPLRVGAGVRSKM
jgi:hypothetical protein